MEVIEVPIEQLIPYANNPRKNEDAVEGVVESIKEFGFTQPLVVNSQMVVLAGHTRLIAARQLGFKLVPVYIATRFTDDQSKAYRIADNKTHENSKWDLDKLAQELQELKESDFNMEATGFKGAELEEFFVSEGVLGLTDEDAEPEVPIEPISKQGNLWILGNHKLLCGDALDVESYTTLLGDVKADMIFTDPPYNVNYSGRIKDKKPQAHYKILNDNLQDGFYEFLCTASKHLVSHCRGAIYIAMSSNSLDTLHRAFKAAGGYCSTFIIWAKHHFAIGLSDYHRQYEPILYGWPGGQKHFWCGARDQADLWFFNKPNASPLHPTMKPVELVQKAIENSSKINEIVLDSFAGSGSTLIACEKTNRICHAMELDPKYCDVVVQRWQGFTGKQAILSQTGKTFQEIQAECTTQPAK